MRRGQLRTIDSAKVSPRQHKKPCSDCPWSRAALPGWTGTASPQEWIASAHGEALIDCHTQLRTADEPWQCAGAAIYRANVCKSPRNEAALSLPSDRSRVFASPKEFEEHHDVGRKRRLSILVTSYVKKL